MLAIHKNTDKYKDTDDDEDNFVATFTVRPIFLLTPMIVLILRRHACKK